MNNITKTVLSDSDGNPSAMRYMSMLALVIAGILAFLEAFKIANAEDPLVLYFLVAAFAPKAVQKFAENKLEGK